MRTLFRDQGITIFSILTALSMTISTIVLAITGVFGRVGRETRGSPGKDEGVLKKWLDMLANELKRLAEKAVEALPAIVGSVVGAILNFVAKAVEFVAEHPWVVIFLLQDLFFGG